MLYTRTGDDGNSSLLGECRMPKDSLVFDALGALDELNSLLGVCVVKARGRDGLPLLPRGEGWDEGPGTISPYLIAPTLRRTQEHLFIIQAQLAGAKKEIIPEQVAEVERTIADIETRIKNPHAFVIAGATELSAFLDLARTVARRTERSVIAARTERELPPPSLHYLNRLSSLLYALARLAAQDTGEKEPSPRY